MIAIVGYNRCRWIAMMILHLVNYEHESRLRILLYVPIGSSLLNLPGPIMSCQGPRSAKQISDRRVGQTPTHTAGSRHR